MYGYEHAGAMLRAFRKQTKLSQKALAAKTQLADASGIGISECILSRIEHGQRDLSPKYLSLIVAAAVFSPHQLRQLRDQAIVDMVRRHFRDDLSPCFSAESL